MAVNITSFDSPPVRTFAELMPACSFHVSQKDPTAVLVSKNVFYAAVLFVDLKSFNDVILD